jgi:hypothetical protein
MTSYVLLVGTYFVKGAKTLLKCLPQGASVELRAEPDNPYDPQAIRVVLAETKQINIDQLEQLEEELGGAGLTVEDILAQLTAGDIVLGHVGANTGKPFYSASKAGVEGLIGTEDLSGRTGLIGSLLFDGDRTLIGVEL